MSNYKILPPRHKRKLKTCIPSSSKEHFIIDMFIHGIILCIVLIVFFLLVVSPLEKDNLQHEIDDQAQSGLEKILNNMSKEDKEKLKSGLNSDEFKSLLDRLKKSYEQPNKNIEIYNNGITNINITIIIGLIFILITIWITLKISCNKCVRLRSLILQNILLFSMVGIMEYLFFVNIAMKFIPVKPSYMKTVISDKLKEL